MRKINSMRADYNIEFVFIIGDIVEYNDYKVPSHFDVAIDTLSQLHSSIDWIPIIGNHDIDYTSCGNGKARMFYKKFKQQYDKLAQSEDIDNWQKQTWNGKDSLYYYGRWYWLQNFSFDYFISGNRYHFLCLDWVHRAYCGKKASLNSFGGQGTLAWYTNDLANSSGTKFVFAHHPCCCFGWGSTPYVECTPTGDPVFCTGFCSCEERNNVTRQIQLHPIEKWFNGHMHYSWHNYEIMYNYTRVGYGSQTESCTYYMCTPAIGWPPWECECREHAIFRLVQVYTDGAIFYGLIDCAEQAF